MLLGCIADDFTGAGDLADTLARGGLRTRLFIDATGPFAACDAGVVALKTRSVPVGEAVARSLAAVERLLAAGCRQILFKYCSTFDSTAEGNIGPVAEALAARLSARSVVVCPAFPATGRTLYQGHLFVGDHLLSESGMERHPLTPMTDPDIRRWLARQATGPVGHVGHAVVARGADAIRAALADAGTVLAVVDAVSDADLRAIGAAAAGAALVTGGSGIAIGLPGNFRRAGLPVKGGTAFAPATGPALVLSGSCSTATRAQVTRYAAAHPALEIDVDALMAGAPVVAEAEAFARAHADAAPLIYSSAEPERVAAAQARHGREASAAAVEGLFGTLARGAVARGITRIVAAGGETSGAVVSALAVHTLDVGPEIDPGVPALSASGGAAGGTGPLALALKSGNFGQADFMERALVMLEHGHA